MQVNQCSQDTKVNKFFFPLKNVWLADFLGNRETFVNLHCICGTDPFLRCLWIPFLASMLSYLHYLVCLEMVIFVSPQLCVFYWGILVNVMN